MVISHKSSFVNTPKNICVAWLLTHKKATTMGKKAIKPGHGHGHVTNWVINMNQFYFAAFQLNGISFEKNKASHCQKASCIINSPEIISTAIFSVLHTERKKYNSKMFVHSHHYLINVPCVFRCASFNIFVVNQAIENSAMHTV